jgi:hypothetical protein
MDADLVASVLPLVSQVASGAPARLSVPRGPLLLSLAVQSALGSGALRLFRTSVVHTLQLDGLYFRGAIPVAVLGSTSLLECCSNP